MISGYTLNLTNRTPPIMITVNDLHDRLRRVQEAHPNTDILIKLQRYRIELFAPPKPGKLLHKPLGKIDENGRLHLTKEPDPDAPSQSDSDGR